MSEKNIRITEAEEEKRRDRRKTGGRPWTDCEKTGNAAAASGLNHDEETRTHMVEEFRKAVMDGKLVPYYQPVYRTLTKDACAAEALPGWAEAENIVDAGFIISAARELRLVKRLEYVMLREICQDIRNMIENGTFAVPLAFHMTLRNPEDSLSARDVLDVLKDEMVPRDMLRIEVGEAALSGSGKWALKEISRLRKAGIKVWLKDLGLSSSTFDVLMGLDFDGLVIDLRKVRRMTNRARVVIRAIIGVSKNLGIQVILEGVTDEEQFAYFSGIGCEMMQGDYLCAISSRNSIIEKYRDGSLTIEDMSLTDYYDRVGRAHLMTDKPQALIEDDGNTFTYFYINDSYRKLMKKIGPSPVKYMAKADIQFREEARKAENDGSDYIFTLQAGDKMEQLKFRQVAQCENRHMLMVTSENIQIVDKESHGLKMDKYMKALADVYDSAYVLYIDEDYIEEIISCDNDANYQRKTAGIREICRNYAEARIHPEDCGRYLKYAETSDMMDRINRAPGHFLTGKFRALNVSTGKYDWERHILMKVPEAEKSIVLELIVKSRFQMEMEETAPVSEDEAGVLKNRISLYSDTPNCFAVYRVIPNQDNTGAADLVRIFANHRYCSLLGLTEKQLTGKSYSERAGEKDEELLEDCYAAAVHGVRSRRQVYNMDFGHWVDLTVDRTSVEGCCAVSFEIIDDNIEAQNAMKKNGLLMTAS